MFLEKASRQINNKAMPFKPNKALVGNVFDALEAVTQLDQYIEPPAWLTEANTTLPLPMSSLLVPIDCSVCRAGTYRQHQARLA